MANGNSSLGSVCEEYCFDQDFYDGDTFTPDAGLAQAVGPPDMVACETFESDMQLILEADRVQTQMEDLRGRVAVWCECIETVSEKALMIADAARR